jgi:PAS domain S-box-containing protein
MEKPAAHENKITEQLKLSEAKFRSVFESSTDGIVLADEKGNIISFNKGAEDIFGHKEKELIGKPETLLMPERYREEHLSGLKRLVLKGESNYIGRPLEIEGLKKDGAEFPIELNIASWKIGERTYFSGIIRDITERREAEETLKKYTKQLEEANQMKDLFTDIMRHDLLNPAGIIRGVAEMLLAKSPGEEDFKMINRNAEKLIEIIENASNLSRLESVEELKKKRLDLLTVIDNLIER